MPTKISAVVLAVAVLAFAGCGSSSNPPAAASERKPSGSASSTEPAFIQEQHAEAAFERRFRHEYLEGKNRGFLRPDTVRFRTPCHTQEGGGRWMCEGWGMEATAGSENCFLVTAVASVSGVEGEPHTETLSPQEEGFDVCREGAGEGQPPGDLNAEGASASG